MTSTPVVPFVEVPQSIVDQIVSLGGPPDAANSRLYRALANNPDQLPGWIEMAWRLRRLAKTPTRLRELMIIRGAQVMGCELERVAHTRRALAAGVSDDVIAHIENWRESNAFSPDERIALQLMEDVLAGAASESTMRELQSRFDVAAQIELILTAGFYSMVPRVVESLRLVREPE
jgi:AhpD family alkylhydroperoxidase